MIVKLRHVHRFRDRHGATRHYLRIPGRKAVALPGEPGSAAFIAAYQAAIGIPAPAPPQASAGSLNALAASYLRSNAFAGLRASSQANYRRILDRLRVAHGNKPIALLDAAGVRRLVAERQDHPAAANHLVRMIRALCAHAVETDMIKADPTTGIKRRRYETLGYRTWTEAEIAQYEAHWPTGTKPRLALALLLYTGQRRSDVVRMGRQHVAGGEIAVRQIKTGTPLTIPIHPDLAREMHHVPDDRLTFLARPSGQGHTAGGFYNLFVAWCAEAGLPPGLSPHGLRKAQGRRLAEAGATPHQIMAILGHKTLSEVMVYTRAAEQVKLARQAIPMMKPARNMNAN